jgi:hypothetical protein
MRGLRVEITTNAADLARTNHWRAQRMRDTLKAAQDVNAALLLDAAQVMSGLTDHSLADLAAMGHPYSRRRPNPPHPPHLIHRQRGVFYRNWRSVVKRTGDDFTVTLLNRSRVGRWSLLALLQHGTDKMIPRPILSNVVTSPTIGAPNRLERTMALNNRRAYQAAMGLHGAAATSRAGKYLRGLE